MTLSYQQIRKPITDRSGANESVRSCGPADPDSQCRVPEVLLTPRAAMRPGAQEREKGAYREYATDEQRRAPGCSAGRM